MKKTYVTIWAEFIEFKEDVVLASIVGGDNYIVGDGNGIGGIGEI